MPLQDCLNGISAAIRHNKEGLDDPAQVPNPLVVAWRGGDVVAMVTIGDNQDANTIFDVAAIAAEGYGADVIGWSAEILMRRMDTGETRDCVMSCVANRAGDVAVSTQPFILAPNFLGKDSLCWLERQDSNSADGQSAMGSMVTYLRSLMLDELRPVPETFVQVRGTSQDECDQHTTLYLIERFKCVVMRHDDDGTLRVFVDAEATLDDTKGLFPYKDDTDNTDDTHNTD